jgi:hypothetical protein
MTSDGVNPSLVGKSTCGAPSANTVVIKYNVDVTNYVLYNI